MPVGQQARHPRRIGQRMRKTLHPPLARHARRAGRGVTRLDRCRLLADARGRPHHQLVPLEGRDRHAVGQRNQSPRRLKRHAVALSLGAAPGLLDQVWRQHHLPPLGIHHHHKVHSRRVGFEVAQAVHQGVQHAAAGKVDQSSVAAERCSRVEATRGTGDPVYFPAEFAGGHGIERKHLPGAPVGHRLAFLKDEVQTFAHGRRRHGNGRNVGRQSHRSGRRPEKEPPAPRRHVPHQRHAAVDIGRHDPCMRRGRDARLAERRRHRPRHQRGSLLLTGKDARTEAGQRRHHDPSSQAGHGVRLRSRSPPRRASPRAS